MKNIESATIFSRRPRTILCQQHKQQNTNPLINVGKFLIIKPGRLDDFYLISNTTQYLFNAMKKYVPIVVTWLWSCKHRSKFSEELWLVSAPIWRYVCPQPLCENIPKVNFKASPLTRPSVLASSFLPATRHSIHHPDTFFLQHPSEAFVDLRFFTQYSPPFLIDRQYG